MLEQFLATFAGVILSFLLWFGGERIIKYQHEKKAREHLSKEIIEEIEENIGVLSLFANLIEKNLQAGNIPVLGQKLNISARHYSITSGELRLINNSDQRELIRNSVYICENFNDFVENTELLLAMINLKEHFQALSQATYRLNQLKEHARETATYLRNIVEELTNLQSARNPSTKEGVMVEKDHKMSYIASIMALIGLLLVALKSQRGNIEDYVGIALMSIVILFFILSLISILLQNKFRNGLISRLARLAFQIKIRRLSLFLGFVALVIALLQYGYPWGLLIAALLVIAADVFLFWPILRKRR
ncbi:MAG: hypothetical protein FJ005_04950 [Chloroflexi bacterium]|nr:hypothetical protein [Chloroflexota bacterium]